MYLRIDGKRILCVFCHLHPVLNYFEGGVNFLWRRLLLGRLCGFFYIFCFFVSRCKDVSTMSLSVTVQISIPFKLKTLSLNKQLLSISPTFRYQRPLHMESIQITNVVINTFSTTLIIRFVSIIRVHISVLYNTLLIRVILCH